MKRAPQKEITWNKLNTRTKNNDWDNTKRETNMRQQQKLDNLKSQP